MAVEHDGLPYIGPVLDDYLVGMQEVDALILGCTHYSLLKEEIRKRTPARVISQDEVIPEKLADYLRRHPGMDARLTRDGARRYAVTDVTSTYEALAQRLMGDDIRLERVDL